MRTAIFLLAIALSAFVAQDYPGEGPIYYPVEAGGTGVYDDAEVVWTFNDPDDLGADNGDGTYDLTEVNTPTATGGGLGYASDFEIDSDQYASVTDNASVSQGSNTSFGFCTWVRPESLDATSRRPVYKQDEYLIQFKTALSQTIIYDSVSGTSVATSSTNLTVGKRHFACFWYDSSDKKAYISIDNETATAGAALTNYPADTANDLEIPAAPGGDWDGVQGRTFYYKGGIPPRATLWNSGKGLLCDDAPTSNLESCWPLSENGGPYEDVVGSNDLTAVNTPTRAAALVEQSDSGMAVRYSGTNETMTLGDAVFDLAEDESFSYSYWMFREVAEITSYQVTVGVSSGLSILNYNNVTRCYDTEANTYNQAIGAFEGRWHFVAGGYDSATNTCWHRADETVESEVMTYPLRASDGDPSFQFGVTSANTLLGQFDNLALWRRALSTAELDELYNSGAGFFYSAYWDFIFEGPRFAWSQRPEIRRIYAVH